MTLILKDPGLQQALDAALGLVSFSITPLIDYIRFWRKLQKRKQANVSDAQQGIAELTLRWMQHATDKSTGQVETVRPHLNVLAKPRRTFTMGEMTSTSATAWAIKAQQLGVSLVPHILKGNAEITQLFCKLFRDYSDDRLMSEITSEFAELDGPTKEPRLTVNLGALSASLDGQSFGVSSEQALRWVKVLADRPGDWISSAILHQLDPELDGTRTHRLKKFLPKPIADIIESDTGKGSRLKLA
jgi:hypothetical protein